MTQKITSQKLIIDCDPGQDDAINLFLALAPDAKADYEVLGITAVAGNVGLDKTERNTRLLCELTGRADMPVYAGCDAPLVYPLATAEEVHGREGLEGVDIHEPAMALQSQNAVDFIVETLLEAEEASIRLVVTGPMTNIAAAIQKDVRILPKIQDIVLMGGALREGGNITPSAEFNIYVDPHAAKVVFESGCPLVIFGLDVTHKVLSSATELERMKALNNPVAQAAYNLLTYYGRFDADKYGTDGAPLHDPCTMAYILRPELFSLKSCNIRVETESDLTRGHTAVDFWHGTDLPKNCLWAYDVDCAGFFDLLVEQLSKYK
ncbi:purine nucleosidase [Litorimonas taeanensis]|uniref:Purine nucleosidase n=1 Tax=Litorimonas taeanensis TaxID=568099 RepID=A0A420WJG1_9PROT|nr:nucleoside hydrolase [Litorimonas taeanensis]RKQ71138.1 purine nucleosidase [Litorimonas taeanensis]